MGYEGALTLTQRVLVGPGRARPPNDNAKSTSDDSNVSARLRNNYHSCRTLMLRNKSLFSISICVSA